MLLPAESVRDHAIAMRLRISRPTVLLWRSRFAQSRVAGLMKGARRAGRRKAVAPKVLQRVVEATLHTTPPAAATYGSILTMAQAQRLWRTTVHRIWRQYGLRPQRLEPFKLSRDPHFVQKLREGVGLYLDPPHQALLPSVDEKSQRCRHGSARGAPVAVAPGERAQTHDSTRHGRTTRFAALRLVDGKLIGQCLPRHRSQEFLRLLNLEPA